MPDEVRTIPRDELERFIIGERLPKQYSAADGGRAARFRLAQDSISARLGGNAPPEKRALLAGTLNSLRAFSGEFAKYAENRAVYDSAKQIYDEYLASPESAGGSMLIPAEINGEKVKINAADLADIAYGCERRMKTIVSERRRAAEQEFGGERTVNGVDFYGLSTAECADALLGYAENIAAGRQPEGAAQTAFAELNRRLAEKHTQREKNPAGPPAKPKQERAEPQDDLRGQLERAMERIAELEAQNKRLSELNRTAERTEKTPEKKLVSERAEKTGTVRERISFKQLLAEAGVRSQLTTAENMTPEKSVQKQGKTL